MTSWCFRHPREMPRSYKSCVVPDCPSKSNLNPEKVFFTVPKVPLKRKKWFESIKRSDLNAELATNYYVCDDHFDLENDLQNYVYFKYRKPRRTFLKDGVVPHIFDNSKTLKEKSALVISARKKLVNNIIDEHDKKVSTEAFNNDENESKYTPEPSSHASKTGLLEGRSVNYEYDLGSCFDPESSHTSGNIRPSASPSQKTEVPTAEPSVPMDLIDTSSSNLLKILDNFEKIQDKDFNFCMMLYHEMKLLPSEKKKENLLKYIQRGLVLAYELDEL